jgi:hypothetical protein
MTNHAVTPTLYLGPPPPDWPRVIAVASAEEAVAAIEAGQRAFLPERDFASAKKVLAHFGLNDAQIGERMRMSSPCTFGSSWSDEDPSHPGPAHGASGTR